MSKLANPRIRPRPHYGLNRSTTAPRPGLQGSAMPGSTGGAVTNGTTYREVVAVAGCDNIRVRVLTAGGAAGTLNIKPIRPQGLVATDESVVDATGDVDSTKVNPYATGVATVAVVAATEVKLELALFGENYVLVEFVASANGSITFADVCTLLHTS